jgi:hypothetical protein
MVGARLARHRLSVGNGRKNTSYQHERGKVVIAVAFEAGKPARSMASSAFQTDLLWVITAGGGFEI